MFVCCSNRENIVKRREAATTVRMLAKENFGLKVLFVYKDVDVEGHMIGWIRIRNTQLRISNQPHHSNHVLSVAKSNTSSTVSRWYVCFVLPLTISNFLGFFVLFFLLCCLRQLNFMLFYPIHMSIFISSNWNLVSSLLFLNMIVRFGFLGFYCKRVLREILKH